MPRKKKASQLTPVLLARFDALLHRWGGHVDDRPLRPEREEEYVNEYDQRRMWLHAAVAELARKGKDLDGVCADLADAKSEELCARIDWVSKDRNREVEERRRAILKNLRKWLREAQNYAIQTGAGHPDRWASEFAPPVLRHLGGLLRELDPTTANNPFTTPTMPRGAALRRARRGPLGTPWLTTVDRKLKEKGIPPRLRKRLLEAIGLRPFPVEG